MLQEPEAVHITNVVADKKNLEKTHCIKVVLSFYSHSAIMHTSTLVSGSIYECMEIGTPLSKRWLGMRATSFTDVDTEENS